MAAIHVKSNLSESESYDAMEFSLYEISFPKYGVSMKIDEFRSRFYAGKITSPSPEPPLKHFHAVFGSGFTKDLQQYSQEWGLEKYGLSMEQLEHEEDTNFFKRHLKRMKNKVMALANSKDWRAAKIWNPMKGLQFERIESNFKKLHMSGFV